MTVLVVYLLSQRKFPNNCHLFFCLLRNYRTMKRFILLFRIYHRSKLNIITTKIAQARTKTINTNNYMFCKSFSALIKVYIHKNIQHLIVCLLAARIVELTYAAKGLDNSRSIKILRIVK